jgi:hypothetical protein
MLKNIRSGGTMKLQTRYPFIGLIVLIAMIISIALPTTAFADGAPPPPPAPAGSGPQTSATTTNISTILSKASSTGTDVVVVNERGHKVALASQEAAKVVATSDPMWCPSGVTPGGSGCSSSFTTFNGDGTNPGLLSVLAGKTGPGTIWIESNYDSSKEVGPSITLDGSTLGTTANWALTLQGGWGGTSGSTSTFTIPLNIFNWNNDVTINDITIDSTDATGLYVTSTGNINLNNVKSNHNTTGAGAFLDNRSGIGNISVNNGTFNDNGYRGLSVYSNGSITLTNVTANNNGFTNNDAGAYLDNCLFDEITGCAGTGDIEVDNSTFNGNGSNGLEAYSNGKITLMDATADDNYIDGTYLDNSRGNGSIKVDNSTFGDSSGDNGNGVCGFDCFWTQYGLEAYSNGAITLVGVTADGNFMAGAYLDNSNGTGSIEVDNSSFNYNSICGGDCPFFFRTDGLDAYSSGNILLKYVTANDNYNDGAYLDNSYGTGSIEVDNSTFGDSSGENGNGNSGLEAYPNGDITLNNTDAIGNYVDGAYIETPGAVIVNCGHYNDNSGDAGIVDKRSTSLTLNGVELSGNSAPYLYGGIAVIGTNCNSSSGGSSGGHHDADAFLPIHTIDVLGGEGNGLDCTQYGGTQLILPNNDSALFPCPISDSATLGTLTLDKLPGALPDGDTFGSAITTNIIKNGTSQTAIHGLVTVSFVIPDDMKNAKLAILYWDGSKWVKISGHFETTTDLTGTFVLVSE